MGCGAGAKSRSATTPFKYQALDPFNDAGYLPDSPIAPHEAIPPQTADMSCLVNLGRFAQYYELQHRVLYRNYKASLRLVQSKQSKLLYVLKQVSMRQKAAIDRAKAEAAIIVVLGQQHPNIVRLFEVFHDDHYLQVILEHLRGGTLFQRMLEGDTHTERETASAMMQVLQALAYMHERSVCHRDMKPEHVMVKAPGPLCRGHCKVIDFKTACIVDRQTPLMEVVGTPFYNAPEVQQGYYYADCDVWSTGVIMYLLLVGFSACARRSTHGSPDTSDDDKQTHIRPAELVRRGKLRFNATDWTGCSDGAQVLLQSMLCKAESRIQASDACMNSWLERQATKGSKTLLE